MLKHKIGYACINTSIDATTNKTCRLANATELKLREIIEINLNGLIEVLKWNKKNNILLFRISSDIIPFASHPVNKINWIKDYSDYFFEIGQYIINSGMRVSMHPGQYVNINSPNPKVVENSIKEINWHVNFLDALGLNSTHRIIFHVGGVYGDKIEAVKNFINTYKTLPENVKARLSLENDDKSYTAADVISINEKIGIPLIFDNLHHQVNNEGKDFNNNVEEVLKTFFATWCEKTGIPKIHYSTQKPDSKPGNHAQSINIKEFLDFYLKYDYLDFDIMFETKDKEKSVLAAFEALEKLKI